MSSEWGSLWFFAEEGGSKTAQPTLLTSVSGRFSSLVPDGSGSGFVAIRSAARKGGAPSSGDTLVALDSSKLHPTPFWSADGRLRLVGRAGKNVVVLLEDLQGTRVASIDPGTRGLALSPPFEVTSEIWAHDHPDLPDGQAAPLGANRWLLRCGTGLCLVQVSKDKVQLSPIASPKVEWITASATGPVVRVSKGRCLVPGTKPVEKWGRLQARACPKVSAQRGIAVDGVLQTGTPATLSGCLVRRNIALPVHTDRGTELGGVPKPKEEGAGVVLLPLSREVQNDLAVDLLVRGRSLSLSFAGEPGALGSRHQEFLLSLPERSVTARPVQVEGRHMYHVGVRLQLPYDPDPACVRGRLLVRVRPEDVRSPDQAFAERSWSFGRCEGQAGM